MSLTAMASHLTRATPTEAPEGIQRSHVTSDPPTFLPVEEVEARASMPRPNLGNITTLQQLHTCLGIRPQAYNRHTKQ